MKLVLPVFKQVPQDQSFSYLVHNFFISGTRQRHWLHQTNVNKTWIIIIQHIKAIPMSLLWQLISKRPIFIIEDAFVTKVKQTLYVHVYTC